MAETTKILWCDSTMNFWWGCEKVGPGCDHCYANDLDKRTGGAHWGSGAPRKHMSDKHRRLPFLWQSAAKAFHDAHLRRRRVFCGSMMDFADNAVPLPWAEEAFDTMERTPDLLWMPLTKRIGNVERRVPDKWKKGGWPQNVGMMATVVNQLEADRDVKKLVKLKRDFGVPWIGLSIEPLLGTIFLGAQLAAIDLVIVGGESGHHARPMHPDWARSLRYQCLEHETAFLFKQWGNWIPVNQAPAGLDTSNSKRRVFIRRDGSIRPSGGAIEIQESNRATDDPMLTYTEMFNAKSPSLTGNLIDGIAAVEFPKQLKQ